ncbi:MAG: FeoB small GTPase domain-containing protein, partial [Eikenella corrodens]|uniref:FeoB small GTPase domain-containing protein n=1 Tax=Eikenella corrodens TaxID=539 RepID=UPI003624548A
MELSYFALIGAPNCGKTVLFNGLTGSHAKVANYPGVTVDKREGAFLDDEAVRIIDLPGTYSLRTTSPDEAVAKDVMVGKMGIPPDAIIAVADATNLRMTLRMILELKTLKLPMVVSLNMSDVARRRGLNIDAAKLSELLDAPVLETVAVSASGVQAVREAVVKLPRKRSFPANPASAERTIDALESDKLYQEVESILAQVVRTQMTLPAWHKKLDDIVLHPVWGMILLLFILFMVFQA